MRTARDKGPLSNPRTPKTSKPTHLVRPSQRMGFCDATEHVAQRTRSDSEILRQYFRTGRFSRHEPKGLAQGPRRFKRRFASFRCSLHPSRLKSWRPCRCTATAPIPPRAVPPASSPFRPPAPACRAGSREDAGCDEPSRGSRPARPHEPVRTSRSAEEPS
jgi:hypothetical protein